MDKDKQQTGKTGRLTLGSGTKTLQLKSVSGAAIRPKKHGGHSRSIIVEVKKSRSSIKHSERQKSLSTQTQEKSKTNTSTLTENERSTRLDALKQASNKKEHIEEQKTKDKSSKDVTDILALPDTDDSNQHKKSDNKVATDTSDKTIKQNDNLFADENHDLIRKNLEAVNNSFATRKNLQHDAGTKEDDEQATNKAVFKHYAKNRKDDDVDSEQTDETKKAKTKRDESRRKRRLTIVQALLSQDTEDKMRSMASIERHRKKKRNETNIVREKEKLSREVVLPEFITVQELANRMAERAVDVTRELMKMGIMAKVTQLIDADTAELVASEFGHTVKRVTEADVENILSEAATEQPAEIDLQARAPVVTIMGHVDHGKTSLLDAIRESNVVSKEAGGITQHIGAYQVKSKSGQVITFIDTPGHEAFTAMRSRGASVTDIVILVVAADDGIMAQTEEAINHAKAAKVPIIVAINKIDKPEANPQKIKTELLEHELVPEDMGGDTLVVEVSAKQKLNIDDLLETILLQSEMLELKVNFNKDAKGIVIEARMEKERGIVATLLVKQGTLKIGENVIAGKSSGKIRAMMTADGENVTEAAPSVPVEVLGLNSSPEAGDEFHVLKDERKIREIVGYRTKRERDMKAANANKSTLEDLFAKASDAGVKEMPLIIKADVKGSAEAIEASLTKLPDNEVKIKVLHSAVGGISESDINLANASNAIIVAFNVRADNNAKTLAEKEGVDIRYYSVIYDLVDDMKKVLSGMLKPIIREEYLGTAEVRQVFNLTKVGKVAGCFVTDGLIKKGAGVRLLRDNIVIHQGKLRTLKRFKDDVKEVGQNFECGIAFENYDDIKVNDKIEAFEIIEEKRNL